MDQHRDLLGRMASISPGVRAHLGGELWQEHIDPDEVTPNTLVLECFSLMIDEAYELGLEFFCSRGDLCADFYQLDLTLLLFEVVYPTPLYLSITEDEGFRNWIIATVRDAGGDPDNTTIIDLLEYLATDHPTAGDTFVAARDFLIDKAKSTPVFDHYIISMLEADNVTIDISADPNTLRFYLDKVRDDFSNLMRAADCVAKGAAHLQAMAQLQYARIGVFKDRSVEAGTLVNQAWVFHMQEPSGFPPTPIEQALIARFTREFEAGVPLFESYYRMRAETLAAVDCVSLVIGCFQKTSTKPAFVEMVDATFDRLKDLLPQGNTATRAFITHICLTMAQEFYP